MWSSKTMKRLPLISLALCALLTICSLPSWASVTKLAGCNAVATNCTPSNGITGDLLVGFARRLGSATAPSLPTNWTSITTGTIGSSTTEIAYRVACRVMPAGAPAAVTFTNAADVDILVYRGAGIFGTRSCGAVGTPVKNGATSTTTYTYGALTLTNDGGANTSWAAGFIALSATSSGGTNAPTGMK